MKMMKRRRKEERRRGKEGPSFAALSEPVLV